LLDAIDALKRESYSGATWRVVREERDPLVGSPSRSRWCNGRFDVLYTSLERDGALSEVHAFLALQPVFPSRVRWFAYELRVTTAQTLKLADLESLGRLGVETGRYGERIYQRTQAIADAAHFLGFDGLIAPSARWPCLNLVLFTDRLPREQLDVTTTPDMPVDWGAWRKQTRK
jgi:hypothetical protein